MLTRLEVGRVTSLIGEVRDAVHAENIPFEVALQTITSNPARILKLRGKGEVVAGADADINLLDPATLEVRSVIAKGRWLMRDGEALVKGTFE